MLRVAAHNAKDLELAVEKAERQLKRPKGNNTTVNLRLTEIQIRPELFQPREFSYGLRETDKDFVKRLARAAEIVGELDPIVVIKLGKQFVCVDGHHRLEAYKAIKWTKKIKCEWFNGTAREAVDASVARNAKDRLNVSPTDRREAAWKRVLLGWGSKKDIVKLCQVADGTVANMRRVKERAADPGKLGAELRQRLGQPLKETSWSQAKLAWLGVQREEISDELRAERLAKAIKSRLTNMLSRDPKITARALELYDPELPKGLAEAWRLPNSIRKALAKVRDDAAGPVENPYDEAGHIWDERVTHDPL